MIESRCGLLCSECKWREIMKCGGCLAIKKPFWGPKCSVKTCCEDRGKANCGLCDQFPCKQLHEFAFDPATQNEGDRIERCEEWAREQQENR